VNLAGATRLTFPMLLASLVDLHQTQDMIIGRHLSECCTTWEAQPHLEFTTQDIYQRCKDIVIPTAS
jgi:hypothetical protein